MTFPLSPKQVHSIAGADEQRISIWEGAVRSGKTVASLIAFLGAVAVAPRSGLILIIGRTLQTIERNILNPLADDGLMGPLATATVHTRGATTATILGREVHLIGASDARAEGRLRGLTACLAMVDEATLVPEEFWTQLLARLSVPGARLLATTNPGSPRHWLKVKYLDRSGELSLRSWHFTLEDNPALDAEYVSALKAESTGLFYARNIDGRWVAAEGAVYSMWDEGKHVTDAIPDLLAMLGVGIDYGTTNATSAVALGLTRDHRLVAVSEWRHDPSVTGRRLTDAEQSAGIRAWIETLPMQPQWVIVDPAAASFKVQLWQDGVLNVMDADNSVVPGIQTVAGLLGHGDLVVHRSCAGVLDEVGGYCWDPKATEKGEDRPLKIADHSLDALRYVVHSTETIWTPYVHAAAAA